MTLILRQITRRAGGGEIVRNRVIDGDTARIGRGADCPIRIPDLAVSLHHATVTLTGPGRLRIDAAGDQPFARDGAFTRSAEFKAADGSVLGFGDHTLSTTMEGDQVVLTLNPPGESVSLADADHAEATGFAPRRRLLSKRTLAWTGFGLVLVACLLIPILAFNGRLGGLDRRIDVDAQWSAGPLSQSHAFLENDCQACHQQAFVAVRDDTCLTCHSAQQPAAEVVRVDTRVRASGATEAPARIRDHAGAERLMWGAPPPSGLGERAMDLARKVFNRPEQRCATCHVEHVANPLLDKPLPKPTLQVTDTCTGCHATLDRRLKDTDLANAPDWAHHPEMRPRLTDWSGPRPRVRRVSMASRPVEPNGLTFPHDLHLAPGGGVARMAISLGGRGYGAPLACANCHTSDGAFGFRPVQMEAACSACHSLNFATPGGVRAMPHGDVDAVVAFLGGAFRTGPVTGARSPAPGRRRPGDGAGVATGGGVSVAQRMRGVFSPGGACFDCHTVQSGGDGFAVEPVHLTDRYLGAGAFDHRIREHRVDRSGQPTCATCHDAAGSGQSADLMLPRMGVCAECHGKPAAPAVVSAAAECSTCHSYHAPARPTPRGPDGRREPAIMDGAVTRAGRRGRIRPKTPVR